MSCCKKCGTIKMFGMEYCSNCGTKFPKVTEPVWYDDDSVDLFIDNNQITLQSYNTDLFDLVFDIGQNFVESYIDLADYLSHWGKYFDSVFKNAIPYFLKTLISMINYFYDFLYDNGIDYIPKDEFVDTAVDLLDIENDFKIFNDWAEGISEQIGKIKTLRDAQRSPRGRWQGGGFGIKGAIKGAISASILNLGADFLRGIGDSYIDSRDAEKIKNLKNQTGSIINPQLMLSQYYVKYYLSIMSLSLELLVASANGDSLKYTKKCADARDVIRITEEMRSDMIFDANAIDNYKKIMCEAIQVYPFDPIPYLNLIESGGCESHEIEAAVGETEVTPFFEVLVKLKVSEYQFYLQTLFSDISDAQKIDFLLRLERLSFGCSCLYGRKDIKQICYIYRDKLKKMGLIK